MGKRNAGAVEDLTNVEPITGAEQLLFVTNEYAQ
jgi:hypothetical protein